jgi:HD superfamily phosphodiesterase
MNLTVTTESAENLFKQILEEFFISQYDEKLLPSHGIDHHRRVWSYAKEISILLNSHNLIKDSLLPSKLIIACYMHDIGMSVDPGFIHGKLSRDLCIRFMEKNRIEEADYPDVLYAIENHDNKEYKSTSDRSDLLSILSVADDLDAFGFIGIYRYSEIYLTRGINYSDIGKMISDNAKKRFENFVSSYGFEDSLVPKHKKRFNILENFFDEYNKQVSVYEFESDRPAGYCGVVEILKEIVLKKMTLEDVCRESWKYSKDPVIQWFFNEFVSELT